MANEDFPAHDILPIPEGLDEATLEFVLSHLAQVAMDYGLPLESNQIDLRRPESIGEFIKHLEEQIAQSEREAEEKEEALKVIQGLIDFYKNALRQTREA